MINPGLVEEEKLTKIISKSGRALSVDINVMVFPEPGGPQSKKGLCSESQEHRIYWWRIVSTVGIMTSASVTFWGSISTVGTFFFHKCHYPSSILISKSIRIYGTPALPSTWCSIGGNWISWVGTTSANLLDNFSLYLSVIDPPNPHMMLWRVHFLMYLVRISSSRGSSGWD